MDYQKISESILKLTSQLEEVSFNISEIKEILAKQRNEELIRRISQLELSMKDQHIKLDSLSSMDIISTIIAPAPATVKVASKPLIKKREDNIVEEPEPEPIEDSKNEPKTFSNITEYFKFLYVNYIDLLFEKNIMTKEFVEKIKEEGKDKFGKKKNELVLQKSIAFAIWRALPQPAKDIIYSMKNDNANDQQKKNATEINEELESSK